MRITHDGLTYEVRADQPRGWILSTVRTRGEESKQPGTEYMHDTVFPGAFDATCRSLLDRMMRDGLSPHADLTEAEVLGWCWTDGVDKDEIETSLQANIDGQIDPVTANGVPW